MSFGTESGEMDRSADHTLEAEITRLTFHKFAPTIFVGAIGIVGAMALLAHRFHDPWLWAMVCFTAIVSAARIALPLAFERRRSGPLTPNAARRWQTAHALGTTLLCCNIAASTLYTFSYYDETGRFICTIGTFILCTGIGGSFGMRPWLAQACGLVPLGALAISIFRVQDPLLARTGCAMIGLFAIVYCKLVNSKYEMVLDQLRLKRQMSNLAEHDALTGLANRRQFQAHLAEVCRQSSSFAVLFMDLDGFKKVNDTHGHAAGDALLQHVGRRLQAVVKGADLLARLGGDEFAVLHTTSATPDSAQQLAMQINGSLAEPYAIDGHVLRIGVSIGIQTASTGLNDPNQLLSQADEALYQVKQTGRGSFRFANSQPDIKTAANDSVSPPFPRSKNLGQALLAAAWNPLTLHEDQIDGPRKLLIGVSE